MLTFKLCAQNIQDVFWSLLLVFSSMASWVGSLLCWHYKRKKRNTFTVGLQNLWSRVKFSWNFALIPFCRTSGSGAFDSNLFQVAGHHRENALKLCMNKSVVGVKAIHLWINHGNCCTLIILDYALKWFERHDQQSQCSYVTDIIY